MNLKSGNLIFDNFLMESVYQDTQEEKYSVSLTANKIYRFRGRAELDFGGGEYSPAGREEIQPEKRAPEDDYGWWNLEEGAYLLELNEKLCVPIGGVAVLQPHSHLLENGASHPTVMREETDNQAAVRVPLEVPENGLAIKENARVSTLRIITD